jgi:hypothetical protein
VPGGAVVGLADGGDGVARGAKAAGGQGDTDEFPVAVVSAVERLRVMTDERLSDVLTDALAMWMGQKTVGDCQGYATGEVISEYKRRHNRPKVRERVR